MGSLSGGERLRALVEMIVAVAKNRGVSGWRTQDQLGEQQESYLRFLCSLVFDNFCERPGSQGDIAQRLDGLITISKALATFSGAVVWGPLLFGDRHAALTLQLEEELSRLRSQVLDLARPVGGPGALGRFDLVGSPGEEGWQTIVDRLVSTAKELGASNACEEALERKLEGDPCPQLERQLSLLRSLVLGDLARVVDIAWPVGGPSALPGLPAADRHVNQLERRWKAVRQRAGAQVDALTNHCQVDPLSQVHGQETALKALGVEILGRLLGRSVLEPGSTDIPLAWKELCEALQDDLRAFGNIPEREQCAFCRDLDGSGHTHRSIDCTRAAAATMVVEEPVAQAVATAAPNMEAEVELPPPRTWPTDAATMVVEEPEADATAVRNMEAEVEPPPPGTWSPATAAGDGRWWPRHATPRAAPRVWPHARKERSVTYPTSTTAGAVLSEAVIDEMAKRTTVDARMGDGGTTPIVAQRGPTTPNDTQSPTTDILALTLRHGWRKGLRRGCPHLVGQGHDGPWSGCYCHCHGWRTATGVLAFAAGSPGSFIRNDCGCPCWDTTTCPLQCACCGGPNPPNHPSGTSAASAGGQMQRPNERTPLLLGPQSMPPAPSAQSG